MVKIVGIIMIIGSSGFLGNYIHKTMKNRCEILKEMLSAIDVLQAEIVFKRSELPTAIKKAADRIKGHTALFWNVIGEGISNNEAADKAFGRAFEIIKTKGLTKDDVEIINTLAGVLGKYDSLEQVQMMKNIKEMINMQWLEGSRELKEKGKLYRALGLSFGLVVALVMI